ncbi:tartrate dehydrogenase [Actibacterium mucosum]|uniref:tartrate dehydrogenase n=1 Tax=Actibacterium mucosum TaxID=1087332 RepID=UPI000550C811|nr:tartrate dehydrogenase [Actibacterium mucosum]
MKNDIKIAMIPGDGIGPEVLSAGLQVMKSLGEFEKFSCINLDWGSEFFLRTGKMMPENGLDILRPYDAILFGSAGDPRVSDDKTLWGLRLAICQGLDQYANTRPIRLLDGVKSPLSDVSSKDLDWIIIRENSEGEYSGVGGRVHQDLPLEVGMDVSVMTRAGCERIQRFAFETAAARPRKHLTLVTKSNAQRHAMVLWDEVFETLCPEYPDVTTDRMLVDAMTVRMVRDPASLDTIVASNLHADILSDLAAALAGSIGIAPTGNINPDLKTPSMFEPIHGSAFDLVGKGIANPIGTFWSIVLMLRHLGRLEEAEDLMHAIEAVLKNGEVLPPDLGGDASTQAVTDAVIAALNP